MTWDDTYFEIANVISQRSKDQHTKVGAVIVANGKEIVSMGYNCFPRGINDNVPERQSREQREKYFWFEHAERNAIYNAARNGIALLGTKIYVPWMPCADCARAIIQVGIIKVVLKTTEVQESWKPSCSRAETMFREAGVEIRLANEEVFHVDGLRITVTNKELHK